MPHQIFDLDRLRASPSIKRPLSSWLWKWANQLATPWCVAQIGRPTDKKLTVDEIGLMVQLNRWLDHPDLRCL